MFSLTTLLTHSHFLSMCQVVSPLEGKISIYFHFYDMFWGILSRGKFLPPVLDKKFSADVIQLWPELHIIAAS